MLFKLKLLNIGLLSSLLSKNLNTPEREIYLLNTQAEIIILVRLVHRNVATERTILLSASQPEGYQHSARSTPHEQQSQTSASTQPQSVHNETAPLA